jgi:hypothetical protein
MPSSLKANKIYKIKMPFDFYALPFKQKSDSFIHQKLKLKIARVNVYQKFRKKLTGIGLKKSRVNSFNFYYTNDFIKRYEL